MQNDMYFITVERPYSKKVSSYKSPSNVIGRNIRLKVL